MDTAAMLEAFLNIVPDKLAEGQIVEPGDFGTVRVSVSSAGAEKAENMTAHDITDVRVIFTPGRCFRQILDTIQFQKEPARSPAWLTFQSSEMVFEIVSEDFLTDVRQF